MRRPGELSLIFVTNPQIRAIHRRFLGVDRATDVVAFPYAGAGGDDAFGGRRLKERPPFGDVYVSVDQARRQAAELGHSLLEELVTLSVHGTLHLRGYDDHAPADRRRMFGRQEAILRRVLPKRHRRAAPPRRR